MRNAHRTCDVSTGMLCTEGQGGGEIDDEADHDDDNLEDEDDEARYEDEKDNEGEGDNSEDDAAAGDRKGERLFCFICRVFIPPAHAE